MLNFDYWLHQKTAAMLPVSSFGRRRKKALTGGHTMSPPSTKGNPPIVHAPGAKFLGDIRRPIHALRSMPERPYYFKADNGPA
jgi:hypothetical protein